MVLRAILDLGIISTRINDRNEQLFPMVARSSFSIRKGIKIPLFI